MLSLFVSKFEMERGELCIAVSDILPDDVGGCSLIAAAGNVGMVTAALSAVSRGVINASDVVKVG